MEKLIFQIIGIINLCHEICECTGLCMWSTYVIIAKKNCLQGTSVLCILMMAVTLGYIQRIMCRFLSLAPVQLLYSVTLLEAWSCFWYITSAWRLCLLAESFKGNSVVESLIVFVIYFIFICCWFEMWSLCNSIGQRPTFLLLKFRKSSTEFFLFSQCIETHRIRERVCLK